MEQTAKSIPKITKSEITVFPKLGTPIPVKQATFQAETFWPAKLGAELSANPSVPHKHPKMKMTWIDGRGLMLEWEDGSFYCVPQTNVKGFEVDMEALGSK